MAVEPEAREVKQAAGATGIQCLLFDFGGVLVDWEGVEPLVSLSGGRLTSEQARRFWLESVWVRRFETGRCTPLEFGAGVVDEIALGVTPAQFIKAFESWDKGPLPGAVELARSLGSRFRLMCLSNNNVLHWSRPALQELARCFERCYASFQTGLMKPDPEAFQLVIRESGTRPEGILFLDDTPECVDAARRAGMQARQVRGVEMVRATLAEMGLLPV